MSKLQEYIESLKENVSNLGLKDEREIIRYVYIELGKLMNFNVDYTLGNKKEQNIIYNKYLDEEELEKSFETKIGVCRELSMLLEMILKEFGINIETERSTSTDENGIRSRHVYNIVTLKNGNRYKLDLEEDLEFIQSGAKTYFFGRSIKDTDEPMFSEEEMREFDTYKIGYIPQGFYFEDMIWMLKKAVSGNNISIKEKFEFIAENINKYRDISNMKYRERNFFHSRILGEVLTDDENNKIRVTNCYYKNKAGEKDYRSILSIVLPAMEWAYYIYDEDEMAYKELSPGELLKLQDEGLISKNPIPGLKRYFNKRRNGGLEI